MPVNCDIYCDFMIIVVIYGNKNMANISSLKPFKKGADPRRNLKGRPDGSKSGHTRFKELLFEALQKKPFKNKDINFEELIIEQLIYYALKGKFSFYKLLMDYRFGKPRMAEWHEPDQSPIDNIDEHTFYDPEINALLQKYKKELRSLLIKKGILKK